jgi:O-antigen ligase
VRKVKKNTNEKTPNLIPIGVVITSAFFWASTEDAMNLPKFSVLVLVLLPILIFDIMQSRTHYVNTIRHDLTAIIAILLVVSVIATTLTGGSYFNSLFGAHARYNGSLTYLTFILLFIQIAINSNQNSIHNFLIYFYFLALANLSYCCLQFLNLDPIHWNLRFNRIVGFLGNPDFASALLGLSTIIFCYFAYLEGSLNLKSGLNIFLSVISSLLTIATNARQGTGIVLLAIIFLGVTLGFRRSIQLGSLVTLLVSPIIGLSILGMLKLGPLGPFLYKDSITYRGDYWRAAVSMFESNPIFGVGMGRFGDFFREYRDLQQVSRRGARLISDQAHSIPLDFLSSGGLVLFLIYLAFLVVICRMAILSCLRAKSREEVALSISLASLWFGYLTQALISIDQIGLAIWGWVFAALVTVNFTNFNGGPREIQKIKKRGSIYSLFISSSVALIVIIAGAFALVPIWKADSAIRLANALGGNSKISDLQKQQIVSHAEIALKSRPLDGYYFRQSGILLANFGDVNSSIQALKRAIELNPQDAVSHAVLGSILRQIGEPAESLQYLQKASQLDPWNQMNFYERLQSHLALNQIENAKEMLARMKEISSKSELYFEAETLVKNEE